MCIYMRVYIHACVHTYVCTYMYIHACTMQKFTLKKICLKMVQCIFEKEVNYFLFKLDLV